MATSQQLAHQFLQLFNQRSQDEMLKLVDADVRYNGRHGEGEGIHLIREWIDRATTTMKPRRWFGDEELAVVEVDVVWRSPRSGDITDTAIWAIAFTSDANRITSIARYADVGEAITKMGLFEQDALPQIEMPAVS